MQPLRYLYLTFQTNPAFQGYFIWLGRGRHIFKHVQQLFSAGIRAEVPMADAQHVADGNIKISNTDPSGLKLSSLRSFRRRGLGPKF